MLTKKLQDRIKYLVEDLAHEVDISATWGYTTVIGVCPSGNITLLSTSNSKDEIQNIQEVVIEQGSTAMRQLQHIISKGGNFNALT